MCLIVQCLVHQLAWATEQRCSIAELECFWFCGEESGEPLTPCRDRVPGHDFAFMLADGYDVLVGHVKRIFERTGDLMWPGQVELYVKPTNHAPHKKYVLLASDSSEMRLQLETIWHKARLRKHDHTAFVLLLFVYLPRRRSQRLTSLRRDTDSRIQEQIPRVIAHMQEHQISGGGGYTPLRCY
ncbi:hypothetical protein GQ600_17731 [Phytophthora cactorum]|nr:hypothetical protein GQ600_17731 [Phytophthora cactorum]